MISLEQITTKEELETFIDHPDLALAFRFVDKNLIDTSYTRFSIHENCNLIGYIAFKDHTNGTVEFHGGVFKPFRGSRTANRLAECFNIYKNKQDCIFFTYIPEDNIPVQKLVEKLDFKCIDHITYNDINFKVYVEL